MGVFKSGGEAISAVFSTITTAAKTANTTVEGVQEFAEAFKESGKVTKESVEIWGVEQRIELEAKKKQLLDLNP